MDLTDTQTLFTLQTQKGCIIFVMREKKKKRFINSVSKSFKINVLCFCNGEKIAILSLIVTRIPSHQELVLTSFAELSDLRFISLLYKIEKCRECFTGFQTLRIIIIYFFLFKVGSIFLANIYLPVCSLSFVLKLQFIIFFLRMPEASYTDSRSFTEIKMMYRNIKCEEWT